MVAQMRQVTTPWLMVPTTPPDDFQGRVNGFVRQPDGSWALSGSATDLVADVQRILLSYVLGYEDRAELADRYALSERSIQSIITGQSHRFLTLPIRQRLLANCIGDLRMNRSPQRSNEVRRALERLAVHAANIIDRPQAFTAEFRQQVAADLYLLSGAWREQEP